MRIYTVQRRPVSAGADPDVVLVKEGFCWPAAILPPVWLLWHRQWLGLAAYLLGAVVLGLAGTLAGPAAETWIGLGYAVLVGASANDWRRWRLARQGYRLEEVVAAGSLAEAETLYFTHLAREAPAVPPPAFPPRQAPLAPRRQEPAMPLAPWSP